jgi:hypothetical protein
MAVNLGLTYAVKDRVVQNFQVNGPELLISFVDGSTNDGNDRGMQRPPTSRWTFMTSFRIRRDFVEACSKRFPPGSSVLWAGGGIARLPASERTKRSFCNTFQARNRLCFFALTLGIRRDVQKVLAVNELAS